MAGVERKMLDRDGEESGRATSVVRYAPGSHFSPHVHDGGEEFLVMKGTFSDEQGVYGPGTYVRNPIGSKHKPYSDEGCTLFVKLHQFDAADDKHIEISTFSADWMQGLVDGLTVLPLHDFERESTALVRWQPGTVFQYHVHPEGEEIFVLSGTFCDEEGEYPVGTWLRNPANSSHTPFSDEGCIIYVKTGHLPGVIK